MADRQPSGGSGSSGSGGEAAIIATYFAPLARDLPGAFGLKDDCAAITPPPGTDIVIKTDPIRAGVHFLKDADAADIGWKALAVNVSDLAAKGAEPLAYLLAISFPDAPKPAWMKRFVRGLADAQKAFGITLAGGDTDRASGPLSIAVTVFGTVPSGQMVQRATAKPGDLVFVTGTLGDAALGLKIVTRPLAAFELGLLSHHCDHVMARFDRPAPRLALRDILRAHAHAAMDLSDGLLKDASRMALASDTAITLDAALLPLSPAMQRVLGRDPAQLKAVVAHGDDYEILFTAPESARGAIEQAARGLPFGVSEIGVVTKGSGVTLRDATGNPIAFDTSGWDHF